MAPRRATFALNRSRAAAGGGGGPPGLPSPSEQSVMESWIAANAKGLAWSVRMMAARQDSASHGQTASPAPSCGGGNPVSQRAVRECEVITLTILASFNPAFFFFYSLWTIQPPSSVSLGVSFWAVPLPLNWHFCFLFFHHTSALRNANTDHALNEITNRAKIYTVNVAFQIHAYDYITFS